MELVRSDKELLTSYAVFGDEGAFEELAGRHAAMVYRSCLGRLGDPVEAQDASQAVFVVLVRKAKSLARHANLAAWLHSVARHVSLKAARTRADRAKREEEAALLRETGVGGDSRLGDDLDEALHRLPAAQRQAVILRYLEGYSQEDAARLADCPVGTLSWRVSDGLAKLRSYLVAHGGALGAAALAAMLEGESQAAIPKSLLPSILTASKAAATGAAAEAVGIGANVMILAEGAMKMMLWAKVKVAAVVLGVAVVAGVGLPVAFNAMGGSAPEIGDPAVAGVNAATQERLTVRAAPPAKTETVNGLRLMLARDKVVLHRGIVKAGLDSTGPMRLSWKNVSKNLLVLDPRKTGRLSVYLKGPEGKLSVGRCRGGYINAMGSCSVHSVQFSPWEWTSRPTKRGEHTLWVEFEQKQPKSADVPPQYRLDPQGARFWSGKVRSNAVKVVIKDAPAFYALRDLCRHFAAGNRKACEALLDPQMRIEHDGAGKDYFLRNLSREAVRREAGMIPEMPRCVFAWAEWTKWKWVDDRDDVPGTRGDQCIVLWKPPTGSKVNTRVLLFILRLRGGKWKVVYHSAGTVPVAKLPGSEHRKSKLPQSTDRPLDPREVF